MSLSTRIPAAAIILAGGRASRLGGADKPLVAVAGRSLLERALDAAAGRDRVVVVGGPFKVERQDVVWTREDPPYGGPVAAVIAGLRMLDGEPDTAEVLLLASDLPEAVALVDRLDAGSLPEDADGLIAADADGREQWLAGRYRLAALRRVAHGLGDGAGAPMRRLLEGLALSVVDVGATAADLDTWEAIDEYRRAHPTTTERKHIVNDTPADLEIWVRSAAADLGVDPDQVPIGLLLDVTRETAHDVMRPAGPVTTFLIGLAVGRGSTIDDAIATVRARIAEWDGGN